MAVLNFHLVVNKELLLNDILESMLNKLDLQIEVSHILSIKNWQWEEEQTLGCQKEISTSLEQDRIVVVYFNTKRFENFGAYIERKKSKYIYNFWWNAEATQTCCAKGKVFFQYSHGCSLLDKLELTIAECCMDFVCIAFGEETMYNYSECLEKMIEMSHNVFLWVFKKRAMPRNISSLQAVRNISCLEACLFMDTHVYNKQLGQYYSQNEDGSPHDKNNNKGNPPQKSAKNFE